jgi:GNAT superfamily N-acetyltransferase
MTTSDDIFVRNELRAGDLGRIIALHGECYAALPGFGLTFEAYVARTVAEYILDSGSRVDQSARGLGLGKRLVNNALQFCRENGCKEVFLETTDGLPESQALYIALGFEIVSNRTEELWDGIRPLIRMQLQID